MWEVFENSTTQFLIMASLTMGTILVSVVIYVRQRQRKIFSYLRISSTSLLDVKSEIKDRLKISYDNVPVRRLHLLLYRFVNSGNIPIVKGDYERPVSIDFSKGAQVLTVQVVDKDPKSLEPSLHFDNQKVVLEPLLLNGRDSITISMLVKDLEDTPQISGRIQGVKEIQAVTQRGLKYWCLAVVGMATQLAGVFLVPTPYSGFFVLGGAVIGIYGLVRAPK